jgi:hypothetical protein
MWHKRRELISRDPGRGPIAVFFDFGVVNLHVPIKGEVKAAHWLPSSKPQHTRQGLRATGQ